MQAWRQAAVAAAAATPPVPREALAAQPLPAGWAAAAGPVSQLAPALPQSLARWGPRAVAATRSQPKQRPQGAAAAPAAAVLQEACQALPLAAAAAPAVAAAAPAAAAAARAAADPRGACRVLPLAAAAGAQAAAAGAPAAVAPWEVCRAGAQAAEGAPAEVVAAQREACQALP